MRNRRRMKERGEETIEAEITIGAVRRERVAEATRGPTRSHAGPIARRENMDPTKEAIPAFAMSVSVRLRSSRMMGRSGGMEKVEKKQEKRDSHARWKARMWGGAAEKGRSTVALPSESTGREGVGGSLGVCSMEGELKNIVLAIHSPL